MSEPEYRQYFVDYPYQGSKWSVDIYATSWDDAEQRLQVLKAWGQVTGEVHAVIPAYPGLGWLARLRVAVQLWWLRRSSQKPAP